ncbi:phosphodiesterase [Azorhizobium doebereinerae]|uniref:phosphodiesterase n=1 Tax=Azorhizobium doebereinerae TaxID=281091 RepID=UPI00040D3742|nr:phosphodiesterase [Azorhizobium doebereinerae]
MWIAQVSDPHLRPEGVLYQSVFDTNAAFAAAVRQLNDLSPQPDLVLLTGDVVDLGQPEEYALAREILSALRAPLLAIPGNHDAREAFRAAFAGQAHLPADGPIHFVAADAGPVRVVALDVTVPGRHHGEVTADALAWLDGVLAAEPERPTVLMMHQPPLACGVPYLDAYRCRMADGVAPDGLARVVARYPAIERVLCGHVHRQMQMRFGGTLLVTAPSTATSIALRPYADAAPASFAEPPGFLLHHWRPEGLLTHSLAIGRFPGPYPFA